MTDLTIVQLNDLHGYVHPHPELVRSPDGAWTFATLGGLSRIAAYLSTVRGERPDGVIALDNGDTFHGTHLAVSSEGMALVPLLNALQFDAMTVHWEFAYTPDGVTKIAGALQYPILAINCHRSRDDQLFLQPYRMVERRGLRLAIIGLACPIVDKTMPAKFSTGLYFTNGEAELRRWIDHVRDHECADLVIVLSHLGFPQDVEMASKVPGIDILVSGHTHNRMEHAIDVNGALIFQSGCHGSFLGRLDVTVADGRIVAHRHQLVPMSEQVGDDAGVGDLVSAACRGEAARMGEVVGRTDIALHRYSTLSSTMDDLLLEAIADAAGTGVAFSNGWRYGAPVPAGEVKLEDLWNMVPMNPPVSVVELRGDEIHKMIEQNLERTFSPDPFSQMGGYIKRMRGVRLDFKAENPPFHRIERLFVEGAPVEPDKSYRAAFITSQGVPVHLGRNRRDLPVHAVEALRTRLGDSPFRGAPETVRAV